MTACFRELSFCLFSYTLVFLPLGKAVSATSVEELLAWNTLHITETDKQPLQDLSTRRLLFSSGSCACVCAGTHEGYVQATTQDQCTSSSCVGSFPSCSYGDVSAVFSDGSLPAGQGSGSMTLQRSQPDNCHWAILGSTCAQQYDFGVEAGFIQLISTSTDACVAGSAQQSIAYRTRNTLAAGHFVGNINNSVFTLANEDSVISMNLNQGCILSYKVTSGGPLLGAKSGGKCFPGNSKVRTPGGQVAMRNLQLGDQVLAVLEDGTAAFQPVIMFSHQDPSVVADFVECETQHGHKFRATVGHYVWVTKATGAQNLHLTFSKDAQIGRAEDIQVGDLLWSFFEKEQKFLPAQVQSAGRALDLGIYNPHTPSGSIVVDNIAALSFTDTIPGSIALHSWLTSPVMALNIVLPRSIAASLNRFILHLLSALTG